MIDKIKQFSGLLSSGLGFMVLWSILINRVPIPELGGQVFVALVLAFIWCWLNEISVTVRLLGRDRRIV